VPAYYSIALPVPLRKTFDYLPPDDQPIAVGSRVQVPFGRGDSRRLIGVVTAVQHCAADAIPVKLKRILQVLDSEPLVTPPLLELCQWASQYYHYPLGETLATALPKKLRSGEPALIVRQQQWRLTVQAKGLPETALKRAPKQQAALQLLRQCGGLTDDQLRDLALNKDSLKQLQRKGLVERVDANTAGRQARARPAPHPLTAEQSRALAGFKPGSFGVVVLEGATGSGKTEVYLQAIAQVLARGQQALVLIPEISLSPQTLARFHARFDAQIVALHSGLNDTERQQHWLLAADGSADIIIGTRSAIFTPLPRLGLIVVDEEHDLSFKQQDGLRYSARDLAAVRAQYHAIPLLLGSATPSLETLHNVAGGRFGHWQLQHRPGGASAAAIELFDIKQLPLSDGFSEYSLTEIARTLEAGEQALVFVNRRGFAPNVLCHDCGWQAQCKHCDATLTAHHNPSHLRCHHCDFQRPLLRECPECFGRNLLYLGAATEKAEQLLQQQFANTPVLRVDRDTTSQKQAFQQLMEQIHLGEPCILVGTQMLVKGHHFPKVTLVVVLDADAGLFGSDFRASERTGKMLLQVAGRAGREDLPGRVIIQTHHPDHPLFGQLFNQGYRAFADLLLEERLRSAMPPFSHLAILKAEATSAKLAMRLLESAKQQLQQVQPASPGQQYLGPMPAILERINQRYRFVLQIKCSRRKDLHRLLGPLVTWLEQQPTGKNLRWSLDVDPLEIP